ncbi:XrtA system polysaccharide chain length determinant [Lamprobacter modestohalophilus]|uniref:XrtA system polysaccharide chain length determinant n=1 Tax=Lamprobacter modestohalophilus TaxID=1064514 RepID=UPI001F5B517F|nr:XrtA system polysaccharide chain length determinant [Lamprobacter modestohalophilus]
MLHDLLAEIFQYLRGVWRYRWVVLGLAWVIAIAGWIYVSTIPNEYRASARLFVDTQSVLRPLLRGLTIQPDFAERVSLMSRMLLSRPNLEKVLRMSDLELSANSPSEREAMLSRLNAKIRINSNRSAPIYNLSYEDQDPESATRVVQALVSIFIEEALAGDQTASTTAQNFLDQEIAAYEADLRASELRLADFKRRNAGLLPGDTGYYATLERARGQLRDARLALEEATQRRAQLMAQIQAENERARSNAEDFNDSSALDPQVAAAQARLDDLLLRFTERHPDVLELQRLIDELKRRSAIERAKANENQPSRLVQASTVYGNLRIALNEAEADVASLQARVDEFESRVTGLTEKIDAIPEIEADLTQLTREYNTISNQHSKLLERRESARLSQQVENSVEGIKFRVIDPPIAPKKPSAPNRLLLALAVLVVAVGGGAAAAVALDLLRPIYDDRRILYRTTGLPVLGVVSLIRTPQQRRLERILWIPFFVLIIGLVVGSVIVGSGLPADFYFAVISPMIT